VTSPGHKEKGRCYPALSPPRVRGPCHAMPRFALPAMAWPFLAMSRPRDGRGEARLWSLALLRWPQRALAVGSGPVVRETDSLTPPEPYHNFAGYCAIASMRSSLVDVDLSVDMLTSRLQRTTGP
jgi:hypothetical protein